MQTRLLALLQAGFRPRQYSDVSKQKWIYSFILQNNNCPMLVQIKGILAAKYLVIFLKMSFLLTSVNKN